MKTKKKTKISVKKKIASPKECLMLKFVYVIQLWKLSTQFMEFFWIYLKSKAKWFGCFENLKMSAWPQISAKTKHV